MTPDPDDPRERFTDTLLGNGNHDDAWEIAFDAGHAAALAGATVERRIEIAPRRVMERRLTPWREVTP